MLFQHLTRSLRVPAFSVTRFRRWNTHGNLTPKPFAPTEAQPKPLEQSSSQLSTENEVIEYKSPEIAAILRQYPEVSQDDLSAASEQGPVPTLTEEQWASSIVHGRGVHHPPFHQPTHHIPVASIHFRSHHPDLLELFTHFATHAASFLRIPISRVAYLPTQRTLWTVPRSPFAHKKKQENFERRVHKRVIKAWDADSEVVDRWCRYLRAHALGGVGMRVTRWDRVPLGIGNTILEDLGDHSRKKDVAGQREIQALGERIVIEELKAKAASRGSKASDSLTIEQKVS